LLPDKTIALLCDIFPPFPVLCGLTISNINTLWTGDADLRFYIATVQDG
jgi:hypothetical protein